MVHLLISLSANCWSLKRTDLYNVPIKLFFSLCIDRLISPDTILDKETIQRVLPIWTFAEIKCYIQAQIMKCREYNIKWWKVGACTIQERKCIGWRIETTSVRIHLDVCTSWSSTGTWPLKSLHLDIDLGVEAHSWMVFFFWKHISSFKEATAHSSYSSFLKDVYVEKRTCA